MFTLGIFIILKGFHASLILETEEKDLAFALLQELNIEFI